MYTCLIVTQLRTEWVLTSVYQAHVCAVLASAIRISVAICTYFFQTKTCIFAGGGGSPQIGI